MIALIDDNILMFFFPSKSRRSKTKDRKLYVGDMMSGELVFQKEPCNSQDRKGVLDP